MSIRLLGIEFDATKVSKAEKESAEKSAQWTILVHKALNSKEAIVGASIIPEGEPFREKLIQLVDTANNGLQALVASGDIDGVAGRLQRLGAQLSQAAHGEDHETGISKWIHIFEAVISIALKALA